MAALRIARERRGEQDLLRGGGLATPHGDEMRLHLAQPARVGCPVGVGEAPLQVGERGVALAEEAGQSRAHDARHPARDEQLAAGEALRFVQHRHRVAHPADAAQQEHVLGMAGAQGSDRREVDRTLRVGELAVEALPQRVEVDRALAMPVRVGELAHQQEDELRVGRDAPGVDLLEIGELGPMGVVAAGGLPGEGQHQQHGQAGGDCDEQAVDAVHCKALSFASGLQFGRYY